jgi:hypothetical protein
LLRHQTLDLVALICPHDWPGETAGRRSGSGGASRKTCSSGVLSILRRKK